MQESVMKNDIMQIMFVNLLKPLWQKISSIISPYTEKIISHIIEGNFLMREKVKRFLKQKNLLS